MAQINSPVKHLDVAYPALSELMSSATVIFHGGLPSESPSRNARARGLCRTSASNLELEGSGEKRELVAVPSPLYVDTAASST